MMHMTRRNIHGICLAVLISCTLLLTGCSQEPGSRAEVGKPAPTFTLNDTEGRTWSLEELKGQVVFVNFWATWCPSCLKEMPGMQKLYTTLPPDKFKMLAILYNDTPAMAVNFVKRAGFTFPILVDTKGFAPLAYGLTGVPETYIVDKQGILREKFIGEVDWTSKKNVQMLMKYINAPNP